MNTDRIIPTESDDIDLIKEYFSSDVKVEHFHNPIINMLLDMREEGVEVKLNKDSTGLAFNKPFEDINVIYRFSLKENKHAIVNYLIEEAVLKTAVKHGWWDEFKIPLRKELDWVGRFLNAKSREKKIKTTSRMKIWGRDKWILSYLTPELYLEYCNKKTLRWGDWNLAYLNARSFYFRQRDKAKLERDLRKQKKDEA